MLPQEIIRRKRDGLALASHELEAFFGGYLRGEVADYQISAMLMAVALRGATYEETAALTRLMRDSGQTLQWDFPRELVVDKHSTGGIGDKTSLILLPLCALEGVKVPMIAGRGLGHTGGTLDKLEAIPGMNVRLTASQARRLVETLGGAFLGQTEEMAPLDRRLYALRDVTATVESIPLITASILSKKLAEGLGGLVMDVKFGSGAFMETPETARDLALMLSRVGRECGVNVQCFLTSMNSPLGHSAGNTLEVLECLEIMQGGGPATTRELTLALATAMVQLAQPKRGQVEVRSGLERRLTDGSAFEAFCRVVTAQGGDSSYLTNPSKFRRASMVRPVMPSHQGSWVEAIDVRALGHAVIILGGGRRLMSDQIDPAVGLTALKAVGEGVAPGEPLAMVHANTQSQAEEAAAIVAKAYRLGEMQRKEPLIRDIL